MPLELTIQEKKIFELARPHLQVISNELHTVGGDRLIVIPAAILHDTGWAKILEKVSYKIRVPDGEPEAIKVHEEISALIAERVLRDVDVDRVYIDEIVAIILGHDSRKVALSLNDKILKNADKQSRFSKNFSKIWPLWGNGSVAGNLYEKLSYGVKNWFFYLSRERSRILNFAIVRGKIIGSARSSSRTIYAGCD